MQYFDALDLCVEHNVWVTEELAEKFTLPKDESARNQILEKVAECAYAQENYKLATKKFTQAGNKVSQKEGKYHNVGEMFMVQQKC